MTARSRRSPISTIGGFTLVEVLVALLILAIMSALGYGTYREARISAERTEESLKRSREIEFGLRIMAQDFAQMVPRPIRDPLGTTRLPALRGTGGMGTLSATSSLTGAGSTMTFNSNNGFGATPSTSTGSAFGSSSTTLSSLVDLTRGGWSNTAGMQRSTLQRVSYQLLNDVLKRSYMTVLDPVQTSVPVVQDLLSSVKAIQFRYLDGNQNWQSQWPPPSLILPDSLWSRPVAVEIIVEFKDWGRIRRLIEVAG
jgi:general secretion pathway protein J